MATKPNLVDRKSRAFDVAVGDLLWIASSYHEVQAVEFNVPFEGMVKFVAGEVGNPAGPTRVHFVRGDDEILRLRKTGEKQPSSWVEMPEAVRQALPNMVRKFGEEMARNMEKSPREALVAMLSKGKLTGEISEFLTFASWVVDVCDDDGLRELMQRLQR